MKRKAHALVVLSGGQDSVTCLGLALATFATVSAISFRYNQRHAVELESAAYLCKKYNVDHKVVDLGTVVSQLVSSALTSSHNSGGRGALAETRVGQPHPYKPGLPSSFVPGRNALFLTLAHAHAQEIKADLLITGVCQTDYSGYPDCRDEFIRSLERSLNLGYETEISIVTPLMFLTKAETFALADKVGFLHEVIEHSHTCYNGVHDKLHDWGYGCGECPACELRKKGWEEFKALKAAGDPFTSLIGIL